MALLMLDNHEGIVKKIIEHSGITEEEIAERIRAKQEEYAGLLTEAGAAYSIAKELGVRLESPKTSIASLREGMQDVSLLARVSAVYPARTFQKNGREGKVVNLRVRDSTGETALVLWNRNAEIAERLQKDSVISVTGAYVKNNEVHTGFNGTVSLEDGCAIPLTEERVTRLADVKPGMDPVVTFGRVTDVQPSREYVRDGKTKKVASFTLADGVPRRVVLWDSNAEKEIKPGEIVRLEGYAKENRGETEIHVGWRGKIDTGAAPPYEIALPASKRKAISELRDGDRGAEVRAIVVDVQRPTAIEVCSSCGLMIRGGACAKCGAATPKKSLILNLELDDGRAAVRATLYRNNAESFLGADASDFEQKFDERRGALLGEEMLLTGDARHNERTGSLDFIVRQFSVIEPEKETAKLMEAK